MPIIFQDLQQPTTFYNNTISLDEFNSTRLKESDELISLKNGSMAFRNWCFGGFRLAYNLLHQTKETVYHVKNDLDAVKIYFNRRGNTHISYQQLGKDFTLKAGQCNMLYSAELDSCISHIDNTSAMFSLQITKEGFLGLTEQGDFGEKILKEQAVMFSPQWLPMHAAMDSCISDIIDCPFTGDLKKLFLHAKATELFVLFAGAGFSTGIKSADMERLYFARDYIIAHYAEPLSLIPLSKVTGLNEFKLKKGFKALFKTSVIDFLINYRLEQAMRLLADTSKSVSEVAYEVGYASPAYFSKAFKKKYGVSPNRS